MGARMSPLHNPVAGITATPSVLPQSSGAATLNGVGVDISGKRGCYVVVTAGALTGLATVAAYIQDSADNTTFANVNTTTYPDATLAVPRGVAFDSRGFLYVAEQGTNQVRRLVFPP